MGARLYAGLPYANMRGAPGLGLIHSDCVVRDRPVFVGIDTPTGVASLTNRCDVFIAGIDLAAIAFDGEGRIIGGGQRLISLAPHESVQLRVNMIVATDFRAIARVEVTAAFPYIDLAPYAR